MLSLLSFGRSAWLDFMIIRFEDEACIVVHTVVSFASPGGLSRHGRKGSGGCCRDEPPRRSPEVVGSPQQIFLGTTTGHLSYNRIVPSVAGDVTFMHLLRRQRTLAISPQAFQQACRREIATSLRAAQPATSRSSNTRRQPHRNNTDRANDEADIRWFDKDVDTGDTRRTVEAPEQVEAQDVQRDLRTMNTSLRRYNASIDSKAFHDTVVNLFPVEERGGLAKALALERKKRREIVDSVEISLEPTALAAPICRELNTLLRRAAKEQKGFKDGNEIWKWYLRASRSIPGIHASIPVGAWDVLWQTQVYNHMPGEFRKDRIMDLVEGMVKGNIPLKSDQVELKLEALVANGKGKQALLEWQGVFEATGGQDQSNLQHGVKLFAALGDIRNGVETLHKYQDLFPEADSRIMHPLIAACVQTQNDHMAYSLYLSLRKRLGMEVEAQDFDLVAARFLAHDRLDLALAVFRDMMIAGTRSMKRGALTAEEERKLVESMTSRVNILQSRGRNPSELNQINLEALTYLPRRWQNKFFFGKWIKKLIGMDDLESAAKVVELMYRRGVEPDRSHMNGLIGGLLRSTPQRVSLGETLAWSMVYKRIEVVQKKKATGHAIDADPLEALRDHTRSNVSLDLSRPLPQANMETFNTLGLHCLLKQDWTHLALLRDMLSAADLTMSTFFMNHLLYMRLYNTGPGSVWQLFLTYRQNTHPDINTFDCLWHAQQIRGETDAKLSVETASDVLPSARAQFKMMVEWFWILDQRKRTTALETFGEQLYARIISTYCDSRDFPAVIVAMHGTLLLFEKGPAESIQQMILTGLSNLMEKDPPRLKVGRRMRQQLAIDKSRVVAMRRALDQIQKRRKEKALRNGEDLGQLTGKAAAMETIKLLSELIRTVLVRVSGEAEQIESAIVKARKEMGLKDVVVGDVDATDIEL